MITFSPQITLATLERQLEAGGGGLVLLGPQGAGEGAFVGVVQGPDLDTLLSFTEGRGLDRPTFH